MSSLASAGAKPPTYQPSAILTSAGVAGAGSREAALRWCSPCRYSGRIEDTDQVPLDRGVNAMQKNYATSVKRGQLTQDYVDQRLKLIQPTLSKRTCPCGRSG